MSYTPEEVDEVLRGYGYDPAYVRRRGKTFVDTLMENHRLRAELAGANQRAEKAEAICKAIDKYTQYHQPLDWGVLNDLFDAWRKSRGDA